MKDIKTVGEYAATAVFHKEVKVEIPVTVLAEGNPAGVKAEAKAEAAQEAPVEAPAATEEAAE
jgi:hypothetical protein